ncbi:hypothetical protein ACLEE6_12070 [Lonsdalea quercina]
MLLLEKFDVLGFDDEATACKKPLDDVKKLTALIDFLIASGEFNVA